MTYQNTIVYGSMCVFVVFTLATTVLAQDSDDVEERKKELEAELELIEVQIGVQEQVLNLQQQQTESFARDVAIVDAEIEQTKLQIRQQDIYIETLSGEISDKEETIGELNAKIARQKDSLAQLIRRTNEYDDISLVEVVFSNANLSAFFEDLEAFDSVKVALQDSFTQVRETRTSTEQEKESLIDTQVAERELLAIQELEKQQLEIQEAEKEKLLSQSQTQEAVYLSSITRSQQTAAQIRAELFQLRGSSAIPFGEALDLANLVGSRTGVRPAFILGVITQETKLGENVGNCNLPEDPPEYKWYSIMKPERDIEPYKGITSRLGIDPEDRPLSCAPGYGWGGAMGPAQFIPSTWILYEDRIASVTGNNPPDPWNPLDAFTASSLLLADNGADNGGWDAEWLAAQRYFAGWGNALDPAYAFYGNSVMQLTEGYQAQIDILEGS